MDNFVGAFFNDLNMDDENQGQDGEGHQGHQGQPRGHPRQIDINMDDLRERTEELTLNAPQCNGGQKGQGDSVQGQQGHKGQRGARPKVQDSRICETNCNFMETNVCENIAAFQSESERTMTERNSGSEIMKEESNGVMEGRREEGEGRMRRGRRRPMNADGLTLLGLDPAVIHMKAEQEALR